MTIPRKTAFLAFALFFWIANRGAYRGYFDGDDLDNLAMTQQVSNTEMLQLFASPVLGQSNFRPVGHAFYRYLGPLFALDYPKYVLAIHTLHLMNVFLLWLILDALGFEGITAALGVLLFAFNMGMFEIYWKPMYVFDLLCATFCLSSLLLWIRNRWVWSLLAFWCAYKAKEAAIGLPVVLLLVEWQLGKRRGWKLIPFFAVSLLFGFQALFANQGRDNAYTFRFTREALQSCVRFYGNRVLLFPFGGAVVLLLGFARNRWARVGVAAALVLLAPMLFLPGRLFGAYLYVPVIGVAIAAAAFASQVSRLVIAGLILLWIPYQFQGMRVRRSAFLAQCDDNRKYVDTLRQFVKEAPETDRFVYKDGPEGLHWWGIQAASRLVTKNARLQFAELDTPQALPLLEQPASAALTWSAVEHRLKILPHRANTPDASYIRMDEDTPVWQLGDGWRGQEDAFRWMKLEAHAYLRRPDNAKQFEVLVNVGPALIESVHQARLEVWLDQKTIGEYTFDKSGWATIRIDAPPPSGARRTQVVFKASPGYFRTGSPHDAEAAYGLAIGGFGFPVPP